MTVYRLSGDKIRIALSDSEVLSFFGTYEKFASLSGGTRLAVSLLLKESLEKYGDILGDNLLVAVVLKTTTQLRKRQRLQLK